MKSNLLGLIVGISALTATPGQASAADNYFGIKAGQMIPDIGILGNTVNLGVMMGFPLNNPATSFEAELTSTVSKGDVEFYGSEWDVTTLAGYFVYRSQSTTYVKLKAGLLYEDVTIGGFYYGSSSSGTDTGLSLGVGIGWDLGHAHKIELEATLIEADINFISVSYLF